MSASTRNLKRAHTGIDTACWAKHYESALISRGRVARYLAASGCW